MLKIPAYAVVHARLKEEIMKGELAIGTLLPSEPELEKKFGVSRTTVRRAVELLSRDGYVKAQQGRGTQVLDYKTKQNLNVVTSFSETLIRKGHDVKPRDVYVDIVPASAPVAEDLHIREGELVARVQRIQLSDERPIAIIKNYIPAGIVPDIENQAKNIKSLYRFLREFYNLHIDSAHDRISAHGADFSEAQMLGVAVGSALLYLHRVCYSVDHSPICVDQLSVNGEKYELEINMSGRADEEA